jgi:4-aminobutyrate aminotransferase
MGGDLPMAGLTFRADFANKLGEASQPGTFAGNALSSVVCMTNIDILTDKNYDLMGRATQLGEEIKARLWEEAKETRIIGDIRGRGLFIGIELVKDKETKEPLDFLGDIRGKVLPELLNRGVIALPCGRYRNVIRFMPPLTITKEYLEKATDILLSICKEY